MFRYLNTKSKCILGGLALSALASTSVLANQFNVLYTFTGGNDGGSPYVGLTYKGGNFYGTTQAGGGTGCGGPGCGVVYKITPDGSESVVYDFQGGTTDGFYTYAGVNPVKKEFYGTTQYGGTSGYGTVYKISAKTGKETVLYSFSGGADGAYPAGGVVLDAQGNIYGTTFSGSQGSSFGTVFKIAPDGTRTTLHIFAGGSDSSYPIGDLLMDQGGNLYGVTEGFDIDGNTDGTIFKIAPGGAETILYTFQGGNDGGDPGAGLIRDAAGNFYGTTQAFGSGDWGTVFKLASDGTLTTLYSFTDGNDGGQPQASLVRDNAGNLFGTTFFGGSGGNGTVFEISAKTGKESVLHAFTGANDGGLPTGGLLLKHGLLYGTTYSGGTGWGNVFTVAKK